MHQRTDAEFTCFRYVSTPNYRGWILYLSASLIMTLSAVYFIGEHQIGFTQAHIRLRNGVHVSVLLFLLCLSWIGVWGCCLEIWPLSQSYCLSNHGISSQNFLRRRQIKWTDIVSITKNKVNIRSSDLELVTLDCIKLLGSGGTIYLIRSDIPRFSELEALIIKRCAHCASERRISQRDAV
jgi:hypothetical protein